MHLLPLEFISLSEPSHVPLEVCQVLLDFSGTMPMSYRTNFLSLRIFSMPSISC